MKLIIAKNTVVIASVLALFFCQAVTNAAEVVYDNTTNIAYSGMTPNGYWSFGNFRYYSAVQGRYLYDSLGDEITLAPGGRQIVEFDLLLKSPVETTLPALTLTLYKNDGTDMYGWEGAPGTQLWTATLTDVEVNGTVMVQFNVPNVEVPDTFIWIASTSSDVAGLVVSSPSTIGTSPDYAWDGDCRGYGWMTMDFGGNPVADFAARVVAVPEPTCISLLGAAAISLLRRKRRK